MLPFSYITEGEFTLDEFLHMVHTSSNLIYRIFYDNKYSAWCAVFIIWKKPKPINSQLKLF